MNKNLKTPENIDKLIERQARVPSFLDGTISPISSYGENTRECVRKRGKVYQKTRYTGPKKER